MKNEDYFALDEAIIDAIKSGRREFYEIAYRDAVDAEAKRLADGDGSRTEPWRIVDRRLQAMRKAGRIAYSRQSKKNPAGGWNVAGASA